MIGNIINKALLRSFSEFDGIACITAPSSSPSSLNSYPPPQKKRKIEKLSQESTGLRQFWETHWRPQNIGFKNHQRKDLSEILNQMVRTILPIHHRSQMCVCVCVRTKILIKKNRKHLDLTYCFTLLLMLVRVSLWSRFRRWTDGRMLLSSKSWNRRTTTLSFGNGCTYTHTHTHIYIYI